MGKKLRRISIVKVFAISAAVLCIVSMSSATARELRADNNRITKWSQISDENAAKLKAQALLAFENASRKIAESGLSEADIAGYEKILPRNLTNRFYAVIEVSRMNASPEEKVRTLMQIQGYNCYDYLVTWLTIEVVEIFLGTSCQILPDIACGLALDLLRLADTVFFWATVLCYLGIV
jgi:hypothetical protein